MAWDSSRPVAYRRLVKEWLIYAAIRTALFLLVMRDRANEVSLLAGLLASLPLYIGFSWVLAKFGYQRKTLAELRTPRATTASDSGVAASAEERQRPAPTRRTSGSANRPGQRPASRKRR